MSDRQKLLDLIHAIAPDVRPTVPREPRDDDYPPGVTSLVTVPNCVLPGESPPGYMCFESVWMFDVEEKLIAVGNYE